MTYDQILTLDMIVKTGSFKAASQAMFKSQPSISQAIKKLEEEYQIKLFNRDQYRPQLTEAGKAFYFKAKESLESFQELETFAKELTKEQETEISLSLDAICPMKELSPFLNEFFQDHTSTSLNLNIDLLDGLQDKIINHQVDFAIGSLVTVNDEIDYAPLMELEMIPVISPNHCADTELVKNFHKKIPQIILTSSKRDHFPKIIGAHKSSKYWYTTDIYMKEQLIEHGLGWGRLPKHQVEEKIKNGKLMEIKKTANIERLKVSMYLLKSKTKVLGPTSKKLWAFISQKYSN
jgi:DNA-binding transcriptional LysR family regulator